MARPKEKGLKYFSFDIDFFQDEKVVCISGEYGTKGEVILIRLLCAIYRNGYFVRWDDRLKLKLVHDMDNVSVGLLDNVVKSCVRWELFDKNLFDVAGILTSKGIQRRFFEATKRRIHEDEHPYLIVNAAEMPINAAEMPINAAETQQNKIKEKKETPKGVKKSAARFLPPTREEVLSYAKEKNVGIDAGRFVDFYESKGWMVGKTRMKDWRAAVRGWAARNAAEDKHGRPQAKAATAHAPFVVRGLTAEERKEEMMRKEAREKERILSLWTGLRDGTLEGSALKTAREMQRNGVFGKYGLE